MGNYIYIYIFILKNVLSLLFSRMHGKLATLVTQPVENNHEYRPFKIHNNKPTKLKSVYFHLYQTWSHPTADVN